nr:hypothetical protein [Parvularcula marina]
MPRDFCRRLKAASGKPFKDFPDQGGIRLVRDEHFAMTGYILISIANGLGAAIVSRFNPCTHFLHDLTTVLLSLKFTAGSLNGFVKSPFRCVFEAEIRRFHADAALLKFRS